MLEDTLSSWLSVDQGSAQVEFIVVDNASTDATPDVVEKFQSDFPNRLRYVHEKKVGLSNARNRGIKEASGPIIAFVDDDIYFDSLWLQKMLDAFREHPEVHCVGGNTIPIFEIEKPAWLTDSELKCYGSTLSGDRDRLMSFPEHPFGVNMGFRKDVFETVGEFKTNLGRIKNSLLSNEEKEMFYRVNAAGMLVFYASKAVLQHRIPAERLDEKWLLKRAYWQGISSVIFDAYVDRTSRIILCKEFARNIKRIIIGSGNRNATNIYAYYKNFSFEDRLRCYTRLGIARQSLFEVIRRSS